MAIDVCIVHAGLLPYPDCNTALVGRRIAGEIRRFAEFLETPGNVTLVDREDFQEHIPGDDENVTYFLVQKMGGNGRAYGLALLMRRACDDSGFDDKK